jgi:cell division protein FtsB
MSSDAETIYERVAKLEDEIALLRSEIDIVKSAMRNKIARHEISMIKKGQDIDSIID